jgi:hypothetical protein
MPPKQKVIGHKERHVWVEREYIAKPGRMISMGMGDYDHIKMGEIKVHALDVPL